MVQLQRAARRAKAVSLEEANARYHARFMSLRRSHSGGGVRFSGFLPDIDGETLVAAIERLAAAAPKNPDTGLYPAAYVPNADALVQLAAGFLAAEQPRGGERAMVVAHVDVTVEGASRGAEQRGDTQSGITICKETAERMLCDAVIEPVFESDGTPVGLGSKERTAPTWLRRQVLERDLCCRFPGCHRDRVVHAHHIEHWPEPTELDNLVALCRFHHRKMHEGGWKLRGDPDEVLEFVRPDGKVLRSGAMKVSEATKRRLLGPVLGERPIELQD